MTVEDALANARIPRADAEVLLASLLGKDRPWLLAHADEPLTPEWQRTWAIWSERRRVGEPVSYITKHKEFHGRPFIVDSRVLIPRPSTEGLVDLALETLRSPRDRIVDIDDGIVAAARMFRDETPSAVADVGTGSGCIAVTIACERPDLRVIATDISRDALDVARLNAEHLNADSRIRFFEGDGMAPLADVIEPFLLVSNPPYVSTRAVLPRDVAQYEPHVALFAGAEGTDMLGKMLRDAEAHPKCVGVVIECARPLTDYLFRA